MNLIERARSEFAYVTGALRALRRTTPIGKHPNVTIRERFEELVERFGDRTALISDPETYTYRELNARANRIARWALAQGLAKGDVVALVMPNRADYLAIWLGLAKAGAATALINTNLVGHSLAHCVSAVGARLAIVDATLSGAFETARSFLDASVRPMSHGEGPYPRFDTELDAFPGDNLSGDERRPLTVEDRCLYIYTSGTTGLPKAANMNHYRVQLAMLGFSGVIDAQRDDRVYDCLPMYHTVGGVLGTGVALMNGGSTVLRAKFSAREFWPEIVRYECTVFCYIGELCRYLVNTPPGPCDRAHKIRVCFGNGLRPDVWETFRDRFGLPNIREYYAATEGNSQMFNFDSRPGSVGRIPKWLQGRFPVRVIRFDVETEQPLRGPDGFVIECAPNEVGEVVGEIVNDPSKPGSRFEGYADKAATEKKVLRDAFRKGDAWFRTGDLMRRDELGYFFFVDRIGDTFRWKGENVSTSEVSERMTGFPGLEETTVYGVPVPGADGKAGMASLVVEDMATFDLAAFRAWIDERLPEYARPLFLRFRHKLDVTGTFKQRKVDLVADGFDPSRVSDPLYFNDAAAGVFTPLDGALHRQIASGARRL